MLAAFAVELVRVMVPYFKRDQERWAAVDKTAVEEEARNHSSRSEDTVEDGAGAATFGVKHIDGSVISKQ